MTGFARIRNLKHFFSESLFHVCQFVAVSGFVFLTFRASIQAVLYCNKRGSPAPFPLSERFSEFYPDLVRIHFDERYCSL